MAEGGAASDGFIASCDEEPCEHVAPRRHEVVVRRRHNEGSASVEASPLAVKDGAHRVLGQQARRILGVVACEV